MQYDFLIIGGGVVGAAIARKLSSFQCSVALVDKEADFSFGVSKANSGIIHGGFHHDPSKLKSRLEIQGNKMFDQLKEDLHFPFTRCGIVVAAFSREEMRHVETLYQRGLENGSQGIELCGRSRMLELEPKLNSDVIGGLYAPQGGIVESYRFVFALIESAKINGVDLFTDFKVVWAEQQEAGFAVESEDGRFLRADWIINAAGLHADEVSRVFGGEEFQVRPRKGEEFLLDRNATAFPGRVIFPVPGPVSKGMLVIPTVEGTTMVGPTAKIQEDKEDLSTSSENFEKVFYSARRLVPVVSEKDIITSFAGLRPTLEGNDFMIEISRKAPRLVQVAGIQSPGLTASPAIAEYVVDLLKKEGVSFSADPDFNPSLPEIRRFRSLSPEALDRLIQKDPAFGEVICRCEKVSEGEIIEAIAHGHDTLDGIKFYTRAQMGRCQGGFCTFKILKIIQRETGKSLTEITKRGVGSRLLSHEVGDLPVQERRYENS